MPTPAQQQVAADDAAVEAIREKFGDAEAAKLAADLYKLRRTPNPNFLATFPRGIIIAIAVWFALLETADKLPQLLLSYPRYEAALAEVQAKIMQPDLLKAQIAKAEYDAEASKVQPELSQAQLARAKAEADAAAYQPDMAVTQLEKARSDTIVARFAAQAAPNQPAMVQAQLEKARNDALASALQPDLARVQLQKVKLETLAAAYQPKLSELQVIKLGIDTKLAGIQLPLAEQATALSGAYLNAMSPLITGILGAISPASTTNAQPTQDPPAQSEDFRIGNQWRDKWENYVSGLSGDALEGAQFWAGVRSDRKPHTCTEGKGASSADFRSACSTARDMLATVDKYRKTNADFLAGWNSR